MTIKGLGGIAYSSSLVLVLNFSLLQVDRHPEVPDNFDHPPLPVGIPQLPDCRRLAARLVKGPRKSEPHLVLGQN